MTARPRTIAVMQPYFYPYAGYFRLMSVSDVFVLFDDVQFARRGRVHRSEMAPGRWLSLPLAYRPRDALIKDQCFTEDARATFDARLGVFGFPRRATTPIAETVCSHLYGPLGDVVDFLEAGLRLTADALALRPEIIRSSALSVDPTLRAQSRIIAIVRALEGQCYVNAPGGRSLYEPEAFRQAGIELKFLTPYTGRFPRTLPALLREDIAAMREDINETSRLVS